MGPIFRAPRPGAAFSMSFRPAQDYAFRPRGVAKIAPVFLFHGFYREKWRAERVLFLRCGAHFEIGRESLDVFSHFFPSQIFLRFRSGGVAKVDF